MNLTKPELQLANLDNFTRLWQAMGADERLLSSQLSPQLSPQHKVFLSRSWPYRFWCENLMASSGDGVSPDLINHLLQLPGNSVIPVWPQVEPAQESLEQALMDNGYSISFELVAMGLTVEAGKAVNIQETGGLKLITCTGEAELNCWTRVCSEAFGYDIDPDVIQGLAEDSNARLVLAYENQQPVATALLFNSRYQSMQVTGIHQFGVPEKYRGRGIARQLMSVLLAQSVGNTDFFSLQASVMGKGLYEGLGFKEQFVIRNYRKA
ncbi:GNAT family N-acetyltransferase [Thalassomonas viridans]|uniref:GNAT family N-acetyltransferase n=1 Tax=Thalassomonas viridans TaxID=137584 RepID=A0AAF0C7N2_9GAMM|nr:GNAT family N-acetyltransferase [Thalassomonas viridans]WDE03345.1 GNAT family N-acetyltransferase [Thalassomonas viridans]